MRNEYKEVEKQANQIIDKRMDNTNQQQQWNYEREVGKSLHAEPLKYQHFEMSKKVQFLDDIRKLIYDESAFPEDKKLFNSTDWQLAPVTETILNPPKTIPSNNYIKSKKVNPTNLNNYFGEVQLQGIIKGKSNQIHYNNYHFNLRTNAISFYNNQSVEAGEKCLFTVLLNETAYDYKSETQQYMQLKGQKNIKILRNQQSENLIRLLQIKLLFYSFRGAYALRNEVPDPKIEHYLSEEIDDIGPINFHKESGIKDIIHMKYYREAIGGFLKLLEMHSKKRNNKSAEIFYPRWLKQEFRDMPIMQTALSTNVIPPARPLMRLKIKIDQNEKQGLFHSLKYIFPYKKQFYKRSLIIYDSDLIDSELFKALNNLSFPMYHLGFPQNNLSIESLHYCIKKSSDYYAQVIDLSYNSRINVLSGSKTINLLNNNPSIKKLILRGCQISNEDPQIVFDALASNLTIEQMEINYNEIYNEQIVEYLEQFNGIIEQ